MLIIGYFAMSQDDIFISPVLLIISYVVVIPLAIVLGYDKKD